MQKFSETNIYINKDFNPWETYDLNVTFYVNTITTNFDADSIIHFFQQYSPTHLTVFNEIPEELEFKEMKNTHLKKYKNNTLN